MTVKELLDHYSVSQSALARCFGIPLRTVQDWCAGKRTPPDYVISLIAKCLEYENSPHPKG